MQTEYTVEHADKAEEIAPHHREIINPQGRELNAANIYFPCQDFLRGINLRYHHGGQDRRANDEGFTHHRKGIPFGDKRTDNTCKDKPKTRIYLEDINHDALPLYRGLWSIQDRASRPPRNSLHPVPAKQRAA